MQNISSLALILLELLKKGDERWLSLMKFWQFFNHISALRQILKNLVNDYLDINMRKFQPSSIKTEGAFRERLMQTYCKNAKMQTNKNFIYVFCKPVSFAKIAKFVSLWNKFLQI